jgi:hypothetical protein
MVVRYLPKALGSHLASVSFLAVSSGAASAAAAEPLAREAVEAVGSCQGVRERAVRLPGGTEATPETFAKPRWVLCVDYFFSGHLQLMHRDFNW